MAAQGESYYPVFPPATKLHISTGLSFPEACAHHITNTFHESKVYVIVSGSISKTDNFTRLQKALGDKIVGVRKGIKPHTPWDDIVDIVKDMEKKGVDLIITLGAGSLTDGAKIIKYALANNVSSLDDLARLASEAKTEGLKPPQLPVINIPTSLSGGEYSIIAGGTDTRNNHKVLFTHPDIGADIVILDPALSISTPERIWLSTGVRGIDHCVEGLCSLVKPGAERDEGFAKGLKLLVPSLLITKKDWKNEDARLKEMLGVVESMKGMSQGIPMGGSHGIGHQLGPLGVGHGETSCVMLPAILKYNFKYGDEKVRKPQQKVLDLLWAEETVAEVLKKRGLTEEGSDAGDVVGAIISELGMPRTLKDVGVGRNQLDALAENCLKDVWLKVNPVPLIRKEQVLEVLEMVVGDTKSNL
ncbi:iron-containing alcohol dehydrogenase-like protein [Mollisia scopiformis]|uniref:Iron-containing alcohol dehydrogenase-like protein n=1 Tax=Mollisia scopiformis TaxID=149040 RepID=A0A194X644_MOLSC|nr:iron-containing alcohol dehydrogenase-like protein [Mollisia scopiformis]KUJ15645.1 iron-containing alcohol dehydrogenase-like protein [Mollisia scopiformis]